MNGAHFLDTLRELHYPGVDSLDAHSLDWMFEDETLVPFLEWFCVNIHSSNLLPPKDYQKFLELSATSEGVLEGEQLEEALHNMSGTDHELASEEELREEIEMIESEVKFCKKRKEILINQRNKLSIHHAHICERVSKMDRIESALKQEYKDRLEDVYSNNTQMNTTLKDLADGVVELTGLYKDVLSGTLEKRQSHQSAIFLSEVDLKPYYNMEDRYGQELKNFTRKQFFDGIADIANEGATSRYEFLEISHPVNLLVRGERHEVNMEECKELARLQAIFPKSECQRINSMVEERSTHAACQFAEEKLQVLRDKPYPNDITYLSNKLKDAQIALGIVRQNLEHLGEEEVPTLIKDSAELQVTRILRGDYNLKIARQDYFTLNQDQLIRDLVVQRSRHEFLTMAYELEAMTHRNTHKLLTAVSMLLQRNLQAFNDRKKLMSDTSIQPTRHQRGTVDSRDKFIIRLYQMLDDNEYGDKKQLFLTYTGLEENADKLNNQISALRSSELSVNSSQEDRLAVLESNLRACEAMVYSGSTTTGGQPMLSPVQIVDALTQLDGMLKKVEQAVMDVIKDVDSKKKMLKTDPLLAMERELIVYFHCDQDKLRKSLEDMKARLHALQVK